MAYFAVQEHTGEFSTAEAKAVKAGNTLGYIECQVNDEQGRLVAKAASTCMKLKKE
jgi:acyl-coenzyme A thioesterase PaaI-like protein